MAYSSHDSTGKPEPDDKAKDREVGASEESGQEEEHKGGSSKPKRATGRPDVDATHPREIGPTDNGGHRGENL